jgi:N-acetyl-anhydromuramyl-L-alanine amidase AmpD
MPPAVPSIASPNRWKPASPPRDWKYIVLHHTATNNGSVESIHEAHLKRKDGSGKPWLGIGYHFVIGNGNGMGDGEIEPTFRWKQQMHGAHAGGSNKDYNQYGIGICLVGNFDETPPSEPQRRAVKMLVQTLKTEYHIASNNVVGHRDIRSTECPGKLFPMAEVAGDDRFLIPYSQLSDGLLPTRTAALPGSPLR